MKTVLIILVVIVVIWLALRIFAWIGEHVYGEEGGMQEEKAIISRESKANIIDNDYYNKLAKWFSESYKIPLKPAFPVKDYTFSYLFSYIKRVNAIQASELKDKFIIMRDKVTAVEIRYSTYYGKEAPCLIFGDRATYVTNEHTESFENEFRCFVDKEDDVAYNSIKATNRGDEVIVIGMFDLDSIDKRPTILVDTLVMYCNGRKLIDVDGI